MRSDQIEHLDYIRKLFGEKYNQYEKHLKEAQNIDGYETVWSKHNIDFFPFASELQGYGKQELYREKPADKEYIKENRIKNNEVYYSFWPGNENNGIFFISDTVDKTENKIRLSYDKGEFDDTEMLLGSIEYKITSDNKVKKVICYTLHPDSVAGEELICIYDYFYDNEKITKIIKSDFLGGGYCFEDPEDAYKREDEYKQTCETTYEVEYPENAVPVLKLTERNKTSSL
jgi:hypothetical protein